MRPIRCLGLLTLTGLAVVAEPAQADVYVQVPFVRVHVVSRRGPVGPSVVVAPAPARVPVVVGVSPAPPALLPAPPVAPNLVPGAPPPVPVEPLPTPTPIPMPPTPINPPAIIAPAIPAPLPAMTLAQFAAGFKPLPGRYEVMLLHPVTHCPVKVCFTLRCCARAVKVRHKALIFDLPGRDLVIRFRHNGTVVVRG